MKAIVKINAENVSISLSGVSISINLEELTNGSGVILPAYINMFRSVLFPIIPDYAEGNMEEFMSKLSNVNTFIGFINRYLQMCEGVNVVMSIEFKEDGTIIQEFEKCSFTLQFMKYLNLFKDFAEYFKSLQIEKEERQMKRQREAQEEFNAN